MNINDIQCYICLSKCIEINIPVKINKDFLSSCDCKDNSIQNNNIYCLSCIEDWLEPFNYKTNKFTKFLSTGKCLFCRKLFRNNNNIIDIYKIDYDLLNNLDSIQKIIECPRCNISINGRIELVNHLENECSKKVIECPSCTDYFKLTNIKRHLRYDKKCVNIMLKQCHSCKNNISLYLYNKHINNCPDVVVKCSYCDLLIKKINITEHQCEYNNLKRKILILKEINKNLIHFNQENIFQFKLQCLNIKKFLKDDILTFPSINEINLQINDIYQFSTTYIDLTLFKNSNYIHLPKYNIE